MTGNQALLVVGAVFWAAVTPSISKYNPFNTAGLFAIDRDFRRRSLRRLLWATGIVNILPILVLAVTWQLMPELSGVQGIVAGAVAGIFPVAMPRLLHGVLASDRWWSNFYTQQEWEHVMERWDPVHGLIGPANCNRARSHIVPGLVYLLVCPALGLLIAVI